MYSFTLPSCETEEEYFISKQLFERYVYSKNVIDIAGATFAKVVLNFFRNYVEPVLPHMLFYKRKKLRHFDHNTNVKIESLFSGIKHGCTPVTPSTALHNSVCIMSNIAERKCGLSYKKSANDVISRKTWISLPCTDELNLRGEQLLTPQWNLRNHYSNCRITKSEWLVTYDNQKKKDNYKTLHPLFKRITKV